MVYLIKVDQKKDIKAHHNAGGLSENMNFKLVEPVRILFKDEVCIKEGRSDRGRRNIQSVSEADSVDERKKELISGTTMVICTIL